MSFSEKSGDSFQDKPAEATPNVMDVSSDTIGDGSNVDMNVVLSQSLPILSERQLVKGIVTGITETEVLVNVGLKSEGVIQKQEFLDSSGEYAVTMGDHVDVFLEKLEDINGHCVLSKTKAIKMKAWEDVESAYKENRALKGIVQERIKGGLAVDIGVRAFLPGSLVDLQPVRNLKPFLGKEIEVKIIKVNRKRGNIVVSRRAVLEEKLTVQKNVLLETMKENKTIKGTIKNLTSFGAFVDLGGIDGLLHITDMSWKRLNTPQEMFKVGDVIEVIILSYDEESGKLQLGYKQRFPDPWSGITEKYPIGSKVKGKVISLVNYGAFVELEEGIEGLIHISEMSWSKKIKHPSSVLSVSKVVDAVVLDIDQEGRRISLGLKQAEPNPWEIISETFRVGDRVHGKVQNITDFGIFVEILEGVDGLVHISDITWKRINHPSEVIKKGDDVDAVITSIDMENRRLSLSIKELIPDIWQQFFSTHYVGDLVPGKVTKIVDFGAFVDLGDGVEGLAHISELSEKHIQTASEVVQEGSQYAFKIIKLDPIDKKIGLSLKESSAMSGEENIYYNNTASNISIGDVVNRNDLEKREDS